MDSGSHSMTRGAFLQRAAGLLGVVVFGPPRQAQSHHRREPLEHPEPRPGITAEKVLTIEALGSRKEKVLAAYAAARTYPALFDGIACACSCGGKNGMHRSLLVCFESLQPTGCGECQDEARLIERLAKEDTTLADIRIAVDKKFG
jgi:hypothetical protein